MATLRALLLNQAYNDLEFEPYPNKYIEIFKFEVRLFALLFTSGSWLGQ
jgi:hypothetical protein